MPWKSSAGGAIRRPRTWSKSIRGQISNPIPIVDPLDNNLFTTDRPSTANNIEAEQHVIVDDADTVSRQSPESRDQIGTRYTSESSRTTDHCTLESQLPDAPSSLAARTSISQPSSADDRKDERGGQCQAHQRKKSVIRSALGRLFRRRNKVLRPKHGFALHLPSGRTDSDEPDDDGPPNQHSSDPYGQRPPTCHSALDSKRSFSMPITEYDRALRSHSIGPEDVMAIQSARNSLSADFRLSEKCTSLLDPATHHHESNRWTCGSRLGGLTPRPASSHGRTSKEDAMDDPNEIGRAIFSDAQGLKRRSRSLIFTPCSDVTSTSSPPRGKARRRSAEIRYWRDGYAAPLISPVADEEYMHLPIQGTGKLETQLEAELEQEFELEEQQPLRAQLQPEPQPVRTLGLSSSPKERPVTPPRPATMSRRVEEEERETDRSKSPARSVDSTGPGWADPSAYERQASDLETRMSRLESIVLQLGNSLSVLRQQSIERRLSGSRQLHGQNSNREIHSMLLQSSDMSFVGHGRYSVNRLSTCHSNTSKTTFGELGEVTPRATILSPMVPSHQRQRHAVEDTRPSSGNITSEQYASILALLESERLARGALEAQVRSLGEQMHLMSKSVTYTTSTDQSDSPSLNRTTSLGEGSVWNHDEEDDRQLIAPHYPFNPQSLVESGIAAEIPLYDEYTEAFVTPAETAETAETVELAISGLDAFGPRHKEVKSPSSINTNKTFPPARDV
ncbi:hypothetical protein E4U40_004377 [Claviceps sp. LM458 group G5]|nr:hypothetical protein E4U40_004377 [Claviceps sp. LM458 group G5]